MDERRLTPVDYLLIGLNSALGATAQQARPATRPNPAGDIPESPLSATERAHAAGLMRINHAGEVAAQGLYQGHAAVSRNRDIAEQMKNAASEEMDHLGWCEQRLAELESRPSMLRPLWFAGSFLIGAASGALGDRWSLGFVEETEAQVAEHLRGHLTILPGSDQRSRAIVRKMCEEEEQHGANAKAAGSAALPAPLRDLMRLTAKVMTRTAYWM